MLYRKIPLLVSLAQENKEEEKQSVGSRLASQMREKILDKTLVKARTLASKTEAQTAEWLDSLRKKSDEHKEEFQESYWDQLRKKSKKKETE